MKIFRPFLALAVLAFFLPSYGYAQLSHSMVAGYLKARAQGKKLKAWQRYEVGLGLPMVNANYTQNFSAFNPDGTSNDTSIKKKVKATGYCITYGTYIPLSEPKNNFCMALGIGARGTSYSWAIDKTILPQSYNSTITYNTQEIGIPLSIDMKFGNEAMLDKAASKYCFTFGVGAFPAISQTKIESMNDNTGINTAFVSTVGTVRPFIKAEFGAFAGILFKIRATVNFGPITLINPTNESDYSLSSANINTVSLKTESTSVQISLLLLPFSWDWGKDQWWRK